MTDAQFEVNGPTSPRGPTNAFWKNLTANAEMCISCNKRVYATERLSTGNLVYHKACFRCTHCKKILSLSQYTLGDNQPYCKPHYERVFKESGGRYRFGEYNIAGSVAGTTPLAMRQRSSVDILRAERGSVSPIATSGGVKSPVLLSPTGDGSSADSDSVGNVKKLPTFAATRAMFEHSSFASPTSSSSSRSGTPSKSVTPAGIVREMRAKREVAVSPPEVCSPPPVYSPGAGESLSVQRFSDRVEPENDQKTDEKEDGQEVEEVKELELEEREQSLYHRDEETVENHDEEQLEVKLQQPAVEESHSDYDDDDDYLQLVAEPNLKGKDHNMNQKDEILIEFQVEDQQQNEQQPTPADFRDDEDDDDYQNLVQEPRLEDKEQDEVACRHDELVQNRDEDLLVLVDLQQPPAAESHDDKNSDDGDGDEKYPGKLIDVDDVTVEQHQIAGHEVIVVGVRNEDDVADDAADEQQQNASNELIIVGVHNEDDVTAQQQQQQQSASYDDLI